jgi:hypothetical protein
VRLIDRHPLVRMSARVAVASALAGPIAPAAAEAQTAFKFQPSVTVTQLHDSNLFFAAAAPKADFITRVTPEIDSEYRSPLWTVSGGYSFDADRFAEHAELSRADARQQARAGFQYRRSERTTLAAAGAFSRTQTPGELIPQTGLGFARASAQRLDARSSVTQRLTPLTTGIIDYTFTEDRIEGGPAIRTHGATITSNRRISLRDTLNAGYRLRHFVFGAATSTSHGLNLAWSRSVSGRATVAIGGGPNVTDASTGLDLTASLHNRFKAGDVSLAYARSQTTVFGLPDIVQTQSISATAAWSLGRSLRIQFAPGVYQSRLESLRAEVFRVMAGAACPISRNLSVQISVDATHQRGVLFPGFGNETIPRYLASIRLVAAPDAGSR